LEQVWISNHNNGGGLVPLRHLNTDIGTNPSRFPWCQCDAKDIVVHTS
jgi:hypothetical protein